MSAFIVDEITIHRVVTSIIATEYALNGISTSSPDAGTEIGKALYAMNTKAVNCRYRERSKVPSYTYRRVEVSKAQALKSMSCLSYQCAEGNVPSSKLYKALDRVISALAYDIASTLPSFEQAEWG